jgi:hypothetical protein
LDRLELSDQQEGLGLLEPPEQRVRQDLLDPLVQLAQPDQQERLAQTTLQVPPEPRVRQELVRQDMAEQRVLRELQALREPVDLLGLRGQLLTKVALRLLRRI